MYIYIYTYIYVYRAAQLKVVLAGPLQLSLKGSTFLTVGEVQFLGHAEADLLELMRRNDLVLKLFKLLAPDVQLCPPLRELHLALQHHLRKILESQCPVHLLKR
jgi:hypothetical protein